MSGTSSIIEENILEKILDDAESTFKQIIRAKQTMGRLCTIPPKGEAVIIGDVHGDLRTLEKILVQTNAIERLFEHDDFYLICLGDYIDRGPNQVEVITSLLNLMTLYPSKVILLRGNHEGPKDLQVIPHEFPEVLRRIYGRGAPSFYDKFLLLFEYMYTAAIIEGKALLVHGGIPVNAECLEDIAYAHIHHPEKNFLTEILWNDLWDQPGYTKSTRGAGMVVGTDVTEKFLSKIGVNFLVRGHESRDAGYSIADGKVLTLFSCKIPQYRNRKAAYLQIPLDVPFNEDVLEDYIIQI